MPINVTAVTDLASAASDAGFATAAKIATEKANRISRLARAYEHFRFVTQEKIDAFNAKLKKSTLTYTGRPGLNLREHFAVLAMTPIEKYETVPPADVLGKVKAAKDMGVFDTMEVASIVATEKYRDPIVFGRVMGCPDRFFIAQWDEDVKIEDLIGKNEG